MAARKVALGVRLYDAGLVERLKDRAVRDKRTVSAVVELAVARYLGDVEGTDWAGSGPLEVREPVGSRTAKPPRKAAAEPRGVGGAMPKTWSDKYGAK